MTKPSETPETDAHIDRFDGSGRYGEDGEWLVAVDVDFTRSLERRLREAEEQRDDYAQRYDRLVIERDHPAERGKGMVPVSAIHLAGFALKQLQNNPWPTANPTWSIVEAWLADLVKLSAARAAQSGDGK